MSSRSLLRLLLCAAAVGGLTACGGDEAVVEMYDDVFEPERVAVEPGQPVRFVNRGRVAHNALDTDGRWATDAAIDPGDDDVVVLDEPGAYDFYCSFHATSDGVGMAGRLLVGSAAGAAAVEAGDRTTRWTGGTRSVPEDYATIQAAVDAAEPGDLVLVGPGTYAEQVEVTTPALTIRGTDRNDVVIDGGHARELGIIVTADGVAVENLTVRDALTNGVYWRGVTGFRGSYLTAVGNVDYGIYAFDSTDGLFEHSHASGSADAGFYVGQCQPCRIVLDRVTAEYNALGYSGTNAGGSLFIARSTWQHNGAGIVPNTLDSQRDPPARNPTVVGNLVRANGNPDVPHLSGTWPAFGNGILLPGVRDAVVERNLVLDSAYHGIVVSPNLDERLWLAGGNVIRDNVVRGSGRSDLALAGPAGLGNCWAGNEAGRETPWALEATRGCGRPRVPRLALGPTFVMAGHVASRPDIDDLVERVAAQPQPPPQEAMPGGADAPVRPAHDVFASLGFDPDTVELPTWNGAHGAARATLFMSVPVTSGAPWEVVLGLIGAVVPFALLLVWVIVALADLADRRDRSARVRAGWAVVVVLVPVLGVLAYYAVGGSSIRWTRRLGLVAGGALAWIALATGGLVAAGLVA